MTDSDHRTPEIDVGQRRRAERKVWRNALLVSALAHLLIFLGWRHQSLPISPFAAAGPLAGDFRAAAGSMQATNIRTPPRTPIVPPPIPLPALSDIEPVEFDDETRLEPAALTIGTVGLLEGPGLEEGRGRGDGGDAMEGRNLLTPAVPRGLQMPPSNKSLRGETVEVWVFVLRDGRVAADSTQLRPPTSDRGYNRLLTEQAAQWVFSPARKDGLAVGSWYFYKFIM